MDDETTIVARGAPIYSTAETTGDDGQPPRHALPYIAPELRMKWGLALLGEEKAKHYLTWLQAQLGTDSR